MNRRPEGSPLLLVIGSLAAMIAGGIALGFVIHRILRAMIPYGYDNPVEASTVVLSFAIVLGVTVLIRRMLGYPPLIRRSGKTVGQAIGEFASAEPSADRATLKGVGYLILFLALQVVLGGAVWFGGAVILGTAVPAWRYGSHAPMLVAAVPAVVVIFLLERWCARIAGHGPISVMFAVALGWLIHPSI